MLVRIIRESLVRRRRRKLLSFAAVALGIAAATTVATIAIDVGDKVSRELRSFGANISITPAADGLPVAVGGGARVLVGWSWDVGRGRGGGHHPESSTGGPAGTRAGGRGGGGEWSWY